MSSRSWLRRSAAVLPFRLREVMLAHAASRPAEEVCGLLGADAEGLKTVFPLRNVAAEPSASYLIAPEDQLRVLRELDRLGQRLGGIYHSHPAGPARPSPTDAAEAAYPQAVYIIIGRNDSVPMRAWMLGGRGFAELGIEPA